MRARNGSSTSIRGTAGIGAVVALAAPLLLAGFGLVAYPLARLAQS